MIFRRFQFIALVAALVMSGVVQATIVTVETPFGTFEVDLLENEAPITVANFLKYVNDGDFDDLIVHRSQSRFVIQAGGFTFDGSNEFPQDVPTDPAIASEARLSNVRGTVAMALLGSDPDSATSQWFINVEDNTFLDTSSGGFTVFGVVLGDGMEVVDRINNQVTFRFGGAFSDFPLIDYASGDEFSTENMVLLDISVGAQPAEFNRGVSGAWFNAETAGQGWLFDVIEGDDGTQEMFVAWFTYDDSEPADNETDGFGSTQHRWFTASGPITGNVAQLDIFESTGGVFNDPRDTGLESIGIMQIELDDCMSGRLRFDFDESDALDDDVAIVRLSPDALCQSLRRFDL